MEGLEAVELRLNEVLYDNLSFRLDSEYFFKEYIKEMLLLDKKLNKELSNLTSKIDVGFVGSMVNQYTNNGVTLLQTKNIGTIFINENNFIKINDDFHNKLNKSKIYKEDILIARSGSFGKASIYLQDEIINSSDIIIIKAKDVNPYYLTVFLNTEYGKNQLFRFSSGGVQGHVNLTILEKLNVAILSNEFQNQIESLVKQSYQKLQTSKELYTQAEDILLDELCLKDFQPQQEAVNIKSFKNSFVETGRLDAEYYQPKYEEIIERVKSKEFENLGNLVDIKKSIEPGTDNYSHDGVEFVRVSNITKFGISKSDIRIPYEFFNKNHSLDKLLPTDDTILLSKDGTVGIAYKIKGQTNIVTSGALLHLTIKKSLKNELLPEYLTLVLNSKIVSLQAERDAGGSIIQHWKPSEIKEVIIPKIDISIQQQIEEKVQQSFKLKKQSEELLEVAKRSVEIAIEQDEDVALEYIHTKTVEFES
ncbi:restriction endonuclease subunit S [Francisella philomiragia]|uniref:restriction endonuclease subunit S n=1 Tax=Francisella philomiragia TaxID=28110 RepID=UPI002244BD35|nr:restriction endonuclease subunit S [Francisella philomiragia]